MKSTINPADQSFVSYLPELIEYSDSGIISKVIVKDNNCQQNLLCLAKSAKLEEHISPRNATINVIQGKGILTLDSEEIQLESGVFVFMKANSPHALQALEKLAFVLTHSEKP